MTHQTSWLESTGVCGVRQNQAGGSSVDTSLQKRLDAMLIQTSHVGVVPCASHADTRCNKLMLQVDDTVE